MGYIDNLCNSLSISIYCISHVIDTGCSLEITTTQLCPIYIDLAIRLKVVLYLLILEKRCRGVTLSQRFRQCISFQTIPIVGITFANGAVHDSNRKLALLT